jgi:hypothetical protein
VGEVAVPEAAAGAAAVAEEEAELGDTVCRSLTSSTDIDRGADWKNPQA